MASFLTAAAAAIGESGIGGAIVRILIAYGLSRLINGSTNNSSGSTTIDKGVRLQLQPDTTNPIPLVYGSTYLGAKVTDAQIADANQTMWYCLTLCEATNATRLSDGAAVTNTIDEIYMNNSRVVLQSDGITVDYIYTVDPSGVKSVDKNPQGLVKIYLFNNGSGSPVLPTDHVTGATVPTTDARSLMPGWTNDSRMSNLTFALIKLTYNNSKGLTSLPTFQFKVSNGLYQPGDAIYDYMTRTVSGAGLTASQIDTSTLTALNSYAGQEVSYIDPVTFQPDTLIRYKINGLIDPTKTVFDNIQRFTNASGAFINYDITTGKWGVIINRDASPTLHFNDSNILGGLSVTGTSLDSMYNAVEVSFPHRELQSQMDTVRIDIPRDGNTFLNANEPENVLKISHDIIDEPLQALELGYIELYQNRMDQVITFNTDYSMFQVEAADIITVTSSIYSWDHKPFRVVRVREIESAEGGLALEITAQEYDSYIYTAMGTPIRPGVPIGPTPPPIGMIGTPAAPVVTYTNNDAIPSVTITGLTPSGIVDRFEFWRSTDNTNFTLVNTQINSNGEIFDQNTSVSYTDFALPGGTYYFQVRGGNKDAVGAFSPSSTAFSWAPVPTINPSSTVAGTSLISSLLPALEIGALAYLGYKFLWPEIASALSDTEIGQLLGIQDPTQIEKFKNDSSYFKIVSVNDNETLILPAMTDTLTFDGGSGIGITADGSTGVITIENKLEAGEGISLSTDSTSKVTTITSSGASGSTKTFKTIKSSGQPDIVAATSSDTLTLVGGTGITITQDAGTETITISTSSSGGGGGGGGGSGNTPSGSYGNGVGFKLDNCEAYSFSNGRTKQIKIKGYNVDTKKITGGDTYTDNCFPYTFPTLVIPDLGNNIGPDPRGLVSPGGQTGQIYAYPAETPNSGHPWKQGGSNQLQSGGFTLITNSSHSVLNGRLVKYKVINATQIIAYCNFDDSGNPLSPTTYSCYPNIADRPVVWGTTEFPIDGTVGWRFVTYSMIQTWCGGEDSVQGNPTGTYNINQTYTIPVSYQTQTFDGTPTYTYHSRYCRDGNEPSAVY